MSGVLNFKLLQRFSNLIGPIARQRPYPKANTPLTALSTQQANCSTLPGTEEGVSSLIAANEEDQFSDNHNNYNERPVDVEDDIDITEDKHIAYDDFMSFLDGNNDKRGEPEEPTIVNNDIRTALNKPEEHNVMDKHKFYTVDKEAVDALHLHRIVKPENAARSKALNELSLMVRQPSLESFELIKSSTSPSNLAAKVLLYGPDGCGKTSVFSHSLHACYNMNWFIICPVRQYLWNHFYKELTASSHKEGRIDFPEDGANFLQDIRATNKAVFDMYGNDMKTHYTYNWSKREVLEEGSTLQKLIDQGIERPKLSNDVIGALFKEIRLHSHEWPTPTLLALDSVNSIYGTVKIFTDKYKQDRLPISSVTLIHHLQKLLSSEWKHGAALLSVNRMSNPKEKRDDYHPRYLLGETGFNSLNPFVPLRVDNYSNKEFHQALDYLTEMNWIQTHKYRTSEKARRELMFLSSNNPSYIDKILRMA